MARAALVAAIAMVAASCGGGSKDAGQIRLPPRAKDAAKVALVVRDDYRVGTSYPESVDCQEVRKAALNGRIVTLYSCSVDGARHPPAGPVCYAFANNAAVRAPRLGLGCKGGR